MTTTMNMALLCEQLGDHAEADRLYTAILKEHPNYVQCTGLGVLLVAACRAHPLLHAVLYRLRAQGRHAAQPWPPRRRGAMAEARCVDGRQANDTLHRCARCAVLPRGCGSYSHGWGAEALAMLAKVYYDMGNMSAAASTYKKLCAVEEVRAPLSSSGRQHGADGPCVRSKRSPPRAVVRCCQSTAVSHWRTWTWKMENLTVAAWSAWQLGGCTCRCLHGSRACVRHHRSVNRKYLKVLRAHPRSIYAANGFATVSPRRQPM